VTSSSHRPTQHTTIQKNTDRTRIVGVAKQHSVTACVRTYYCGVV